MVISQGKGANHTSSPASAACRAATLSRSGWPPVMRTAVQCSSSAMTRISARTVSESNVSRLMRPPGRKPVS
ncbi:hypothetical protein [Microbispora sp. NPDC049633]|uniref:hypothetical protein n=1 Tax=Microbispora sp. NPDC049633 TaxID=3154355 RepID=UPI003433BDA9